MLRVFLTIVLPLVLPTAIYVGWLVIAHRVQRAEDVRWVELPWVWLAGVGAVLLAVVLFAVNLHFGTSETGTYVPPRWEDGRIVPGHIEPVK
jgi:hypothetical protein